MWRRRLAILMAALCCAGAFAQEKSVDLADEIIRNIAEDAATGGVSWVGDDLSDHFSRLALNPVNINRASRRELERCGLFDPFRVAMILDYRDVSGDILSVKELSLIPGFGNGFAESVAPFVILSEGERRREWDGDALLRLKYRPSGNNAGLYKGVRFRCASPYGVSAGIAMRSSAGVPAFPPERFSFNVQYDRGGWDVVLGDYNVRFGQGALVWTSMSVRTILPVAMLMRSAWGLAPSCSMGDAGNMRGAAVTYVGDSYDAGGFVDFGKERAGGGMNVTRYFSRMSCGLTAYMAGRMWGAGGDCRFQFGRTSVFSEVAYSGALGVWAGVEAPVSGDWSLSALARYAPAGFEGEFSSPYSTDTSEGNEYGVTVAFRHRSGITPDMVAGADVVYFPVPKPDGYCWQVRLKADVNKSSWRFVPYLQVYGDKEFKASVRGEWKWGLAADDNRSGFTGSVRADLCMLCPDAEVGRSLSSEVGYRIAGRYAPVFSVYGRISLYHCDRWDERIYVYERDLAGSMSVPALYGRGVSMYAVFSYRPAHWIRLTFKSGYMAAVRPYAERQKAGYTDLKLQCEFSL